MTTILLVDPDRMLLSILRKILANQSKLNITSAISYDEALNHILATPFDLIVLSIDLPDDLAWRLASVARQSKHNDGACLIGTSTRANSILRQKSLEFGFDSFLVKPFRANDILPYTTIAHTVTDINFKETTNQTLSDQQRLA